MSEKEDGKGERQGKCEEGEADGRIGGCEVESERKCKRRGKNGKKLQRVKEKSLIMRKMKNNIAQKYEAQKI